MHRPQLFFFSYSRIDTEPSSDVGLIREDCVVTVETSGDCSLGNDLVSRLSAILSRYHEGGSNHDVILEPSDVIAFHLKNTRSTPSTTPSSSSASAPSCVPKGFKYPKLLYLDQFLGENFELANQKRTQQMEMNAEVQKLTAYRNSITHFNVSLELYDPGVRNADWIYP